MSIIRQAHIAVVSLSVIFLLTVFPSVAQAEWIPDTRPPYNPGTSWDDYGDWGRWQDAEEDAEDWCWQNVQGATLCDVISVTGPFHSGGGWYRTKFMVDPFGIGWNYEEVEILWPPNVVCDPDKVLDPVVNYECIDPDDVKVLEADEQPSDCPPVGAIAPPNPTNPCNPSSGNKSQTEVDFSTPAEGGLRFYRYYNSLGTYNTAPDMPAGWRHTYSRSIDGKQDVIKKAVFSSGSSSSRSSFYYSAQEACEDGWDDIKTVAWSGDLSNATALLRGGNSCEISSGGIVRAYFAVRSGGNWVGHIPASDFKTVIRPNGAAVRFELVGGSWVNHLDTTKSLVSSGSNFIYTDHNDIEETYNSSGQLTSITYRNGQTETLEYNLTAAQGGDDDNATLDRVTGPFGHELTFAYGVNGKLASVSTPDGTVQYTIDTSENLTDVTYPDLSVRQYVYEDADLPHHLTGIIDENNDRFATWAYDDEGRATLSEHANGKDQVTLAYNTNGTTTMTTAGGATHTYTFTTEMGKRRLSSLSGDVCSTCGNSDVKSVDYDGNGFVSEIVDWNNVTTKTARNSRGLVETLTEAFGETEQRVTTTQWHSSYRIPTSIATPKNTTTFTHDSDGNVLTVTEASGADSRVWTMTYNNDGQLLTIDGPRMSVSDVTTLTYYNCATGDECGQVKSITNALGHVTNFNTYDAAGRITKVTDPNGLETTYSYDARGNVLSVTQSPTVGTARVTTMTYDDLGQLKTTTLPNSAVLTYNYDAAHYLTSIEDSLGNYVNYTRDVMGNLINEDTYDPSDNLTQAIAQTYDVNRRLDTLESGGFESELAFDLVGNVTGETDPGDFVTSHVYDSLNRLESSTDALSGVTDFTYDAHDNLTRVIAPNGATTDYVYDGLDNLTSETSPDRGATTYTYDDAGNVKTITDARNVTATYSYDALNRVTSITYPNSAEDVTYTYDDSGSEGVGRLRSISDQSGTTTYSYNEFGEVTTDQRVIGGITYTMSYQYDAAGNVSSITYPSGRTIDYSRNAVGEVTQVVSTKSSVSKTVVSNTSYLPFGPAKTVTYGNGVTINYEYGLDSRITSIWSTGIADKQYNYDAAANIESIDDGITASLSQSFSYDALGRVLSGPVSLASVDYDTMVLNDSPEAYWRLGELSGTTASDETGNGYDISYNDTYTLGGTSLTGDSDASLRIPTSGGGYAGTTVLTGVTVTAVEAWFETDSTATYRDVFSLHSTPYNRIILIHYPGGQLRVWRGANQGPVIYSDGAVSSGEPHHVVVYYESGTDKTYMMIDGVVQAGTYNGNILAVPNPTVYIGAHEHNSAAYKRYLGNLDEVAIYDTAVTSATFANRTGAGAATATYAYDANGNRTSYDDSQSVQTLNYGTSSNVISTIDSVSMGHDAAGNRTSEPGGVRTYTYSDKNRLNGVLDNSVAVASYEHNAMGQRTKKVVGSTTTIFVYDLNGNLIAEHDAAGNLIKDYVWANNVPVAQVGNGEVFSYLHFDHLGSTRLATDDSQTVVWRWEGDAFGLALPEEDPDGDTIATMVNLRFPGQYYDSETGLHYNYYRTYEPKSGRYVESDPIGLYGGLNSYAYVYQSPLLLTDPYGLKGRNNRNYNQYIPNGYPPSGNRYGVPPRHAVTAIRNPNVSLHARNRAAQRIVDAALAAARNKNRNERADFEAVGELLSQLNDLAWLDKTLDEIMWNELAKDNNKLFRYWNKYLMDAEACFHPDLVVEGNRELFWEPPARRF